VATSALHDDLAVGRDIMYVLCMGKKKKSTKNKDGGELRKPAKRVPSTQEVPHTFTTPEGRRSINDRKRRSLADHGGK